MLLGELLLSKGLIAERELNEALSRHFLHREPLGECLILIGAISEHSLMSTLSEQLGIPYIADISNWINDESRTMVSAELAKKYQMVGGVSGDKRHVFSNENFERVRAWLAESGGMATLAFAKKSAIRKALESY